MLPWFYLDTVYQTMQNSLHDRRTTAQTDSLDLIQMKNVTSNTNQLEPSESSKRTKIIKSIPYSAKSQTHALGRD